MHAQSCLTLCNPIDCSPPGSSVHGDSPGKNTGVDCHFLLQGIFMTPGGKTQGSVLSRLHQQVDSLPLSLQGKETFKRRLKKQANAMLETDSKRATLEGNWGQLGKKSEYELNIQGCQEIIGSFLRCDRDSYVMM